jgi:type IV pilus assembly protein PilY1
VINDLLYYSVNVNGVGKSQLMAGNDGSGCSGGDCNKPVERIATRPPAKLGLKRMSWREIQN